MKNNVSLRYAIEAYKSYNYKAQWISLSVRTGIILLTNPFFSAPYDVLETRVLMIKSWRKFLLEVSHV